VRVLTSSVLVMESIMLGLAIPVVLVARNEQAAVGWLLAALALIALLLPALVNRPWFVTAGWALQVATIACGVFEPMLYFLGAVFAVLWWAALHFGGKVDRARAEIALAAGRAREG
jgi:Protein of unknown function (DUF4233)